MLDKMRTQGQVHTHFHIWYILWVFPVLKYPTIHHNAHLTLCIEYLHNQIMYLSFLDAYSCTHTSTHDSTNNGWCYYNAYTRKRASGRWKGHFLSILLLLVVSWQQERKYHRLSSNVLSVHRSSDSCVRPRTVVYMYGTDHISQEVKYQNIYICPNIAWQ